MSPVRSKDTGDEKAGLNLQTKAMDASNRVSRFPAWLKRQMPPIGKSLRVATLLKNQSIHTVCSNAKCPNLFECYSRGTATFLILGDVCTRNCRFCAIAKGTPKEVDSGEPERIGEIVKKLALKHIVVTSVTRDDLPDGGSVQFSKTIDAIRKSNANVIIEVLTPDFQGDNKALKNVLDAEPNIFNHNLETVPRLYNSIRSKADYARSVGVLKSAKKLSHGVTTKSGLMLGLGEEEKEVTDVLNDLRSVDCDILTLGQYLQPRRDNNYAEVVRFIPPEEFERYKDIAYKLGFKSVASGPFIRSSYSAEEVFKKI
jgi:lipoic acid synthetase